NVLSAVDNETERFLLGQIFDEVRSESSLIISHRPEVLERVDQILLLEEGEIIARGHHRELLVSSAVYRDTWSLLQSDEPQLEPEKKVERGPGHDS
ncbi:MAG: ATP-binding cassette subfamily B multidrug efflux pump, partial [Paraglaciecola psychrophila]